MFFLQFFRPHFSSKNKYIYFFTSKTRNAMVQLHRRFCNAPLRLCVTPAIASVLQWGIRLFCVNNLVHRFHYILFLESSLNKKFTARHILSINSCRIRKLIFMLVVILNLFVKVSFFFCFFFFRLNMFRPILYRLSGLISPRFDELYVMLRGI